MALFPPECPSSWQAWRQGPPERWGEAPPPASLPVWAPSPLACSPVLALPFPAHGAKAGSRPPLPRPHHSRAPHTISSL
uniref:Macaca fascicularis brain cDNA clone: QmoA-10612, similar to human KIAA0355 (KIAA0355), mRNA, RefSeq: NM_014686.2 n=1 Tax=Macaca fascicularis TaxID=9541 RepID=I7G877_MACFA|nr:unnamed protein product [Macaca fascicularis]